MKNKYLSTLFSSTYAQHICHAVLCGIGGMAIMAYHIYGQKLLAGFGIAAPTVSLILGWIFHANNPTQAASTTTVITVPSTATNTATFSTPSVTVVPASQQGLSLEDMRVVLEQAAGAAVNKAFSSGIFTTAMPANLTSPKLVSPLAPIGPDNIAQMPSGINSPSPASLSVKVAAMFALLAGLCFFTGCGTTTTTTGTGTNSVTVTNATIFGVTITPTSVYTTLRAGTAANAKIAMASDTNAVTYLKLVQQVIGTELGASNFNLATLQTQMASLPIGSIHNATAVEAIDAGVAAFELLSPYLVSQVGAQNKYIMPALQGVYDGLSDALGLPVAPYLPTSLYQYEPQIIIPQSVMYQVNYRLGSSAERQLALNH